jgi:hypothetical protein
MIIEDEEELTTIPLPKRRSIQMHQNFSYRFISIVVILCLSIWGWLGPTAQAQESGSLKGVAAFEGEGMLFQLEDQQVYFVGGYVGIMVVGNDKEALNAATMICPATIETNLATLSQSGHGRCILTDKDNNKVYAKWTCYGNPANCKGAFTFTGGTGKFKGISGINEFFVKTDVLAFQKTGEPGMVKKAGAGEAVWPEITYRLPSK